MCSFNYKALKNVTKSSSNTSLCLNVCRFGKDDLQNILTTRTLIKTKSPKLELMNKQTYTHKKNKTSSFGKKKPSLETAAYLDFLI